MSGHSKWATIKHQKAAHDQRRGLAFSKLGRAISIAAKAGGDPAANPQLRFAVEAARGWNMPKENIERAIKRGTGEEREGALEELLFEAYGPEGVALLIEGITDNVNRSTGEVRHLLSQHGGKLAAAGSVRWMFAQKGVLTIDRSENSALNEDALMLTALDAGALDIRAESATVSVITDKEALGEVKKKLEAAGVVIAAQELAWIPQQAMPSMQEGARQQLEALVVALDEREDVQSVYANVAVATANQRET